MTEMTVVERVGEGLARRVSRRSGLSRGLSLVFGVAAAFATDGLRAPGASAQRGCAFVTQGDESCNFPNGRSCRAIRQAFCDGSRCSGGCRYLTDDDPPNGIYPTGCWCTATTRRAGKRGHYKCCDCGCPSAGGEVECGCRTFVPAR
jgi:hypothetical protein